jgi:hypothetical protein
MFPKRVPRFQGNSLLSGERSEVGVFGEAVAKIGRHEKEDEKPVYFYREAEFKIIYSEQDQSWELYNLKKDPCETHNIIGISPVSEKMRQKIAQRISR